jgi:hypothetical protein
MKYLTRRSGVFAKASSHQTNEPVISQIVSQLNAICRTASFDFALSVGECVVKKLYHGDLNRFRSRGRNKEQTLRAIAVHPDLQMSPGALYRSVAAYELCERLGTQSWEHVSLSHMRLVLPLKPDDQARLLQQAESDRWPVQRLDEEVAALMRTEQPERSRGGRRRSSRLHQAIRILDLTTERLSGLLDSSDDVSSGASPETMRGAVVSLQRATEVCQRLQHRLERAGHWAASSPPPPMSRDAPPRGDIPNQTTGHVALVAPANSLSEALTTVPRVPVIGISLNIRSLSPASRSERELALWDATNIMRSFARDLLRMSRRIQNLFAHALELLAGPCFGLAARPRDGLDDLQQLTRQSQDLVLELRSFVAEGGRQLDLAVELASVMAV